LPYQAILLSNAVPVKVALASPTREDEIIMYAVCEGGEEAVQVLSDDNFRGECAVE
jgi:hypothetical protein